MRGAPAHTALLIPDLAHTPLAASPQGLHAVPPILWGHWGQGAASQVLSSVIDLGWGFLSCWEKQSAEVL